jgi:hypothetical protein
MRLPEALTPEAIMLATFVALTRADLMLAAGKRVIRAVRGIPEAVDGFAQERVAAMQREEALRLLVSRSDQVFALLTPNGGASFRDEVMREFGIVKGQLAQQASHIAAHDRWSRATVAQLNYDRAARGLDALPDHETEAPGGD